MFQLLPTKNFNLFSFVSELNSHGFDIHNAGGETQPEFHKGEIYRFKNGQYHLTGTETALITSTFNTYYKTLIDVEKQFNYRLFG
jgi:hypothetical protein